MSRLLLTLAAVAASCLVVGACPPGVSNTPAGQIVDLINQQRAAANCGAVAGDEQLRVAAERHAVDIRDHPGHFGAPGGTPLNDIHTGTDGSNGGTRIADAGYAPIAKWGEIIYWASGPPANTPQASVNWWMNSPGHRAQMLDCDFTHVGVGLLYPGGVKWIAVVDFAKH